jgi:predicted ribosomally synthesized peptide with SipW-like signal peptide
MDDVLVLHKTVFVAKKRLSAYELLNYIIRSKKFSFSLAVLVLVFGVLNHAGTTLSYFNDTETSMGNLLGAGKLDFGLALADPASANVKLTPGELSVVIVPTVTTGAGDFPLAYRVTAVKTGGTSDALCNAIDLSTVSPPFNYTGKLIALSTVSTNVAGPWSLSLSLPSDSGFTTSDTCLIDLVYSGWVDGQTEGIQYHDVERISLVITDPPIPTEQIDTQQTDIQTTSDINEESSSSIESTDTLVTPPSSNSNIDSIIVDSQPIDLLPDSSVDTTPSVDQTITIDNTEVQ